MAENEEPVRVIEKLGDNLGNIIKLTESIYEIIKKKYGINSNTLGIWQLHIAFQRIEEDYTKFHRYFFKELNKKENLISWPY